MLNKLIAAIKRHHKKNQVKSFRENQQAEAAGSNRDLGYRDVPLKQIVGSVGRYHDFDSSFRLKRNMPSARLERIKKMIQESRPFPPLELYKIKNEYYVLDGNHRVAAAKEFGWLSIEAHIVEYLPSKDTLENIRFREKSDFEWQTDLNDLIELTEVGQYAYLLEQIAGHQKALQQITEEHITTARAAKDWYKTIYLPFVDIIKRSHLPAAFPKRTNADLYAYISRHHWKKRRQRTYDAGISDQIPGSMEKFRAKMAQPDDLDPPEMTRTSIAFVMISVAARRENRIMEKLFSRPEVKEVHFIPGEFDIIAKVVIARDLISSDSEVIGQFLQDHVRSIPGVIKTQTVIPISSRQKR